MTTDCPICLCPITSEVWGVINPCGHPYHRDCWKEVVANSNSRRGSSGNAAAAAAATNAKCAICKGAAKGFVPVYVDLVDNDNSNNDDDAGAKLQQDADNDSDEDNNDDEAALDELKNEWNDALGELGHRVGDDDLSNNLLDQLVYIHTTVYDRLAGSSRSSKSSSSSAAAALMIQRQLERMKSKAKNLKTINAELQTLNEQLQSSNTTLHRSSIDAAVAKERTLVKYKMLQSQFHAMERSYKQHEIMTIKLDTQLQTKISQLQTEYTKLLSKSNIDELHEMESIRVKYTKMSQEVHDLKAKNRKLESDIDRSTIDWEVKYAKEKLRYDTLANDMKHLSSHYYQLIDDNDGDVSRSSSLGNTQTSRGDNSDSSMTVVGKNRIKGICKTFSDSMLRKFDEKNRFKDFGTIDNMRNNRNNGGTKLIVSHRQDVIDSQIRRDSIGQPNPFNLLKMKNVSTTAPMTSGREKTNNDVMGNVNNNRGRKAMEALDKSTRKKQQQVHGLKQPLTLLPQDNRHSTTTQSIRLSHDGINNNEEREDSNDTDDNSNDELQLMIKPRLSTSKRKHGSISISNSLKNINSTREEPPATTPAATSSSRSVVATSASYSPRKKNGSITTYFKNKPLPPLAERSYPSYQPHIFFGSDLATSFN